MKRVLIFAMGAAIGSVVSFILTKRRYEKKLRNEIESVKETWKNRAPLTIIESDNAVDSTDKEAPKKKESTMTSDRPLSSSKPIVGSQIERIQDLEYDRYERAIAPYRTDRADQNMDHPYFISPETYGEFDDYSQVELMYYADGVLCDENDDLIEGQEEIAKMITPDSFGEYSDSAVYVRDDRVRCDYEILRSLQTYMEVMESKPYKIGKDIYDD